MATFLQTLEEIDEWRHADALMRDALEAAAPLLSDVGTEMLKTQHQMPREYTAYDVRLHLQHFLPRSETQYPAMHWSRLIPVVLFTYLEALLVDAVTESKKGPHLPRTAGFADAKRELQKMGVDLSDCPTTWEDLEELREKRHCLVHRRSRADRRYIAAAEKTALFGSFYSEGQEIWPWKEHIDHHIRQAYQLAQYLAKKLSIA